MKTEKEVLDGIDALTDATDWSDANVYAQILGSSDDGEGQAGEGRGVIKGESDEAPVAPPQSSEAPAAATPGAEPPPEQVAGVATRDGKHVIPYAVLESAREKARRTEAAEAEAQRLREQMEAMQAQLQEHQAAGTAPVDDVPLHSEEEIARAAADFPELAATMRNSNALAQRLAALQQRVATAPAAPAATPGVDPIQDAIDQHPLLARWQAKGGGVWGDCVELDKALRADPAWASRPMSERFAEVQRRIAADLGVDVPPPAANPTPNNPAPAPAPEPLAASSVRPTLSDLRGTAPSTVEDVWARMDPREAAAQSERLSVEDVMRSVGIPV